MGRWVWLAAALAIAGGAEAQEGGEDAGRVAAPWELPAMSLTRVTGEIAIDGRPDEAAWASLPILPVVQHWPDFRGSMTGTTEIRVGYDDEYLYASGRFRTVPGGVSANSLQRDTWDGDDAFDLIVDSFNDDRTALQFTTTPNGIMIDQEITNDAQPGAGTPVNGDWNTQWHAASAFDDDGWSSEIRVPLASLGFSVENGSATMGIIVGRYLAAQDERHLFPAIPPEWPMAAFKPSLARDVVLEGITEQTPVWVTPYVLSGAQRLRRTARATGAALATELPREMGIDVKYGLSSNLTLDVTVNTDFAQVESDDVQVNLDRFSLFQPDKRQFFQERSSAFAFNAGQSLLFNSRRIGLSEGGDPLRILGGARLVGRVGAWDLGALSMQVGADGPVAGENTSVVRLGRTFDRMQQASGIVTSRIRNDGGVDLSGGVEGTLAVGSDLVTVQFAQTRNAGDGAFGFRGRSMARLFWERRRLEGISYNLDLSAAGAGFDPALGFRFREDYRVARGNLRYSWRPEGWSLVNRANVMADVRMFGRNSDGRLESGLLRARSWVELRGGHFLNVALNLTREDVASSFSLGGTEIRPGLYDNRDVFVFFRMAEARNLGTAVFLHGGGVFDGRRRRVSIEPWWRLGPHLTLGGRYAWHRLSFGERGEVNADIADLRVTAALDARLSASVFMQYSAMSESLATNFRLRYRFAEGRDLFLVVDEGRDLDDPVGADAARLGRTDRRILLKTSWALGF